MDTNSDAQIFIDQNSADQNDVDQNDTDQNGVDDSSHHICTQIWAPASNEATDTRDVDGPAGGTPPTDQPLAEAAIASLLWANGSHITVNIQGASSFVAGKIRQFAVVWSQFANINFQFTNDPHAQVRIAVNNSGASWSYIGTGVLNIDKNKPTMNFSWFTDSTPDEEFSRVVTHEFGHTLGCIHEQASPAANIPWNKPVVYDWYLKNLHWDKAMVDAQVFAVNAQDGVFETPFDRNSIMEYSYPSTWTIDGSSAPTNTHLSSLDKEFIMRCYPRQGPRRNTQDGVYLVNCFRGNEVSSGVAYYRHLGGNDGKRPDVYVDVVRGRFVTWEGTPGSVKFNKSITVNWNVEAGAAFEPTFARVGFAKNNFETWNVYKDRYRLLYTTADGWRCFTLYWCF